jgi:hypothetical protein
LTALSEEKIVRRLQEERWLNNLLRLKQLYLWQDVYTNSEDSRKADLVGIDRNDKVYAFEVKGEGSNVGSAFDQACDYCLGANYVYCILSGESVSNSSKEKLKKTGIGLLLYETKKGLLMKPRLEIESEDHQGVFSKNTKNALSEEPDQPHCYIFPAVHTSWIERNVFQLAEKSKFIKYDYQAKKLPPKGSIVVFYREKHFVGQGTVYESRRAEKGDKTKYPYLTILWAKSVHKYPKEASLDDIKDHVSVLKGYSGRSLIQVIRNYPIISASECQRIAQKALEIDK